MKFDIDNFKYSMLILFTHKLFDKKFKRVSIMFWWSLLSNWIVNHNSYHILHILEKKNVIYPLLRYDRCTYYLS